MSGGTASIPRGVPLLGLDAPVAVSMFSFDKDTFAFPNMIRSRHPDDEPGLYANYCFVLARAIRQFAQFVRFDPAAPKLDHAGYVERVPDPSDRRAKLVRATRRGKQVYAIAREVVAELEQQWTRRIGKARMRELRETLEQLNAGL